LVVAQVAQARVAFVRATQCILGLSVTEKDFSFVSYSDSRHHPADVIERSNTDVMITAITLRFF
jgi:hypothetical protein